MIKTFGLFISILLFSVVLVACGEKKDENSQDINTSESTTIIESQNNATIESNIEDSNNIVEKSTLDVMQDITPTEDNQATSPSQLATTITSNASDLYKKCIACHGVKGDKIAPGSVGDVLIYDLSKNEIIESLKGYKARTLDKGGTAAIMYLQTANLSNDDMEALGEYISNLNK